MKFELTEISRMSGCSCKIYSVIEEGEEFSLFEQFMMENYDTHNAEVKDINRRLQFMGRSGGAREQFFKEKEGLPGDGVSALYDDPDKKLRLYCIRYGNIAVILGGGGAKNTRTWQDDPKLKSEAEKIIKISKIITEAIKNRDTKLTEDGFSEINFESYE